MLTIIVTACSILISEPIKDINSDISRKSNCREYYLPFQPEETLYGEIADPISVPINERFELINCLGIRGQFEISKFMVDKPNFVVNKYKCTTKQEQSL